MYKTLIKNILFLGFTILNFCSDFTFAHEKFDIKNKVNIEVDKIDSIQKSNFIDNDILVSSENNIEDNLMKSFDDYPSFEESLEPGNQFKNLFSDTNKTLKKGVFRLWEAYEKEMSNQIGSERLRGPDINNTFNDSLNSLSK